MSKQRDIPQDSTLQRLIDEIKKRSQSITNKDKVNINGKKIGIFTYIRNKKTMLKSLYLITISLDNEEYKFIYADDGDRIGTLHENGSVELDSNIKMNTEQLEKQLNLMEETRLNSEDDENNGTAKAGEGRDLANKEHEEENKNEPEKEQQNENQEKQPNKILKNLKNEINIDAQPKIRLDEIINGYYFWQVLQLEEKLKGILPDNVDVTAFRTGYLTIVDSKQLESIDSKERTTEDTFVIATLSGDIIELDEQILEHKDLGTRQEQEQAAQSNLRYVDGKEAEKPDNDIDVTRTSLYQIPGIDDRFNVAENWYLAVDKNRQWMENAERPFAGNKKEISFVQASKNESYYSREERIQNTLEYKLDPVNESDNISKEEYEKKQELRNKDANEAQNIRKAHTEELIDKCYAKYENLRGLL